MRATKPQTEDLVRPDFFHRHHSPHFRADIDGLRAVAVGGVLWFHAFPHHYFDGGFTGVDVFFVISGYLITGILAGEAQTGRLSITNFYARRIRRIFPALTLTLATTLLAGWFILTAHPFEELGATTAASAGFAANLFSWSHASYLDHPIEKPLLQIWSLGVEEQFYLVWPLTVWSLYRFRVPIAPAMAVLAALSFAWSLDQTFTDPTAAFYSPASRFWELATGGMLAVRPVSLSGRSATILSLVGIAGIAFAFWRTNLLFFPGLWALLPTFGAAAVLAAGPHGAGNRILSLKPFVSLGLISYPLYLWHWSLLAFAYAANGDIEVTLPIRAALMLFAVGLAALTYLFIERPARQVRPLFLAGSLASVGLAGFAVAAFSGVPGRAADLRPQNKMLEHYWDLRNGGLDRAYRGECDFLVWHKQSVRSAIDATCTKPGAAKTWLLWGDSHAQALSLGLRAAAPEDVSIAQIATSACAPMLAVESGETTGSNVFQRSCALSNSFAARTIAKLRPAVLIVTQRNGFLDRDWEAFGARAKALGARTIVLVGPAPESDPPLPQLSARLYPHPLGSFQSLPEQRNMDAELKARAWRNLSYFSIFDRLCTAEGRCPAQTERELLLVDSNHFSPAASLELGRLIVSFVGADQKPPQESIPPSHRTHH